MTDFVGGVIRNVGDFITTPETANVLVKINAARTRFGLAAQTLSKSAGQITLSSDLTSLKSWIDQANSTSGCNTPISIGDVSAGTPIRLQPLSEMYAKAVEIYNYCSCNTYNPCGCQSECSCDSDCSCNSSDSCGCNCDYCSGTCDHSFCSCDDGTSCSGQCDCDGLNYCGCEGN